MKYRLLLVLVLLGMSSCGRRIWYREDKTYEEARAQLGACRYEVGMKNPYIGKRKTDELTEACMRALGYMRKYVEY